MDTLIRRANEGDAAAICAIYNHHVRNTVVTFEIEPVSVAQMASRIRSTISEHEWIVAMHGDKLQGYAYYTTFRARPAYSKTVECTVYISEHAQGHGIASQLYAELFERAVKQGIREVIAVVALPNTASERVHEKCGFVRAGLLQRVGFKFDRFVDVGYWQRSL